MRLLRYSLNDSPPTDMRDPGIYKEILELSPNQWADCPVSKMQIYVKHPGIWMNRSSAGKLSFWNNGCSQSAITQEENIMQEGQNIFSITTIKRPTSIQKKTIHFESSTLTKQKRYRIKPPTKKPTFKSNSQQSRNVVLLDVSFFINNLSSGDYLSKDYQQVAYNSFIDFLNS